MSNKTCTNSPVEMLMYQELFVLAKRHSGLLLSSFLSVMKRPSLHRQEPGFVFSDIDPVLVFHDLIVSIMVEGTQVVQVTTLHQLQRWNN